ncbi:YdcF family protein [Joostella atrarenae]|uniref:YdcF family protein n=1 Tax=Joostella atrarenae TaxID=679257 RepID=A0ABS9J440_9FLAO|nr:ElyC/SanA/YdcF family protein [Joostella atrarenae]MCF8715192.1 YdcF family protein [Joostella atrarenae]
MKKRFFIKLIKISALLGVIALLLVLISNNAIEKSVKGKTTTNTEAIKHNKVGLVLGTAKKLNSGQINPYFKYRIDAAVELFNAKKVDFLLISGDNGDTDYNEPNDFKNELIKRGIPEDKIFLDFAGFRTLDSVVRAKKIFGQTSITIISQQFHNERAIYLAEKFNIDAVGFNAENVEGSGGIKTNLREYLARTKVFLDLLFKVEPKYLGKKIDIK